MHSLDSARAQRFRRGAAIWSWDQAPVPTRFFILLDEPRNERARRPQQTLDLSGRTVGGAKPDDLGWVPAEDASFLKVGVLRDDCEPVVSGILPNGFIVRAAQPAFMHMGRTGINIG